MGITKTEIAKENFRNIDALWKWVKKECQVGNVEKVSVETLTEDIQLDNSGMALRNVTGRILTIELGPNLDYRDLHF